MPQSISAIELHAALQNNEPIHLLDVRQPAEHSLAALPESQLIPLQELPARLSELHPEPGAKLVIYCHHGVRSWHAAQFLEQQGYPVVYSLDGGIDAWSLTVDESVPRYS